MRLILPGHVTPKARAKVDGRNGRGYHEPRYAGWLEAASWDVAAMRKGRTFDEPITVIVNVGPDITEVIVEQTANVWRPTGVRGDIDNIAGAILDALQQGGLIEDDRLVHHLEAVFRADLDEMMIR